MMMIKEVASGPSRKRMRGRAKAAQPDSSRAGMAGTSAARRATLRETMGKTHAGVAEIGGDLRPMKEM